MLQRMDNVLIVVEDLDAAKAFFAELGMELEGETTVEGPWANQTVGLRGHGAELVGKITQYEDICRLCLLRGPEGIVIGLSEQLS
jgi:catechol 2,3-dioxygenase-like lactoylglutathione lyase family enzyme